VLRGGAAGYMVSGFGLDVVGRRAVGLARYQALNAPHSVHRQAGPFAGKGKRRTDPGHDFYVFTSDEFALG
jgi:hypothetical protein